jgi:hypothetical protein
MVVEIEICCHALVSVPSEDQSPLLIDTDRIVIRQLAAEFLKVIARRRSQVCVRRGVIDQLKLSEEARCDIGGDSLVLDIVDKGFLKPAISEALDHVSADVPLNGTSSNFIFF